MLKEKLKKRALSMVDIPNYFQPILEEYFEGENGEGEAMFSWGNEEQNEGITINLDLAGNLIGLTIDKKDHNPNVISLNIEERRERAEQFFISQYPDALKDLTLYQTKKLSDTYRFYYSQIVMDLPLGQGECFIDIDRTGNIVKFKYKDVKQLPEIKTPLISKEKLIKHVQNKLEFQLRIANLYTNLHDVTEDALRLVYVPSPSFMKYKADVLEPTLTISHEEEELQNFVSLPAPTSTIVHNDLSIEEIIGITKRMEVIREVDMGEDEMGIVWRDKDWEMKGRDLSMKGLFKRHSKDTVTAIISKKTGKIKSFIWFFERNGNLDLSREECFPKAINILQKIFPNYFQYLQLFVTENEEEEHDKESFEFRMHNGHGIPIHLEFVRVAVNRKTGQIDYYSGPIVEMKQLSQISAEPAISKKEACDIFINHLDFKLEWNKNYDSEPESHTLVYQAYNKHSGTPIRYIDAMTGEVISEKEY
ncbi:uncharacterized protein YuzE [Oikeobacillus pervagus]|uniref:Uncharacterized protein YuzE n=1 Tax=Oikeobacillus pervagus TaxID=1325931 RepID=A0AAJ1WKA6_9BACI|nr:YcdB/YcdC domain-containing protein [Oikeobacillus pervagus]MDQ0216318.1 uncharacterized protein YuzE [Oikeobacillus pervagus]